MSLRLIARRTAQVVASAGVDAVLMGISLPSDTVINSIRLQGGVLSSGGGSELDSNEVTTYAMEAWVLPIDDPDATADFDDIWDTLVPKDSDVQTLDLDAQTADTSVFYEPGETDWQALFDLGLRPDRVWHRVKELSINNTMGLKFVDSQTPFAPKWQPGDQFRFNLKRKVRIRNPSVFLIGVGVPAGDDTITVVESPLAENEWGRVKYLGDTLKMAMMDVLGIIEAGAETPWEDATDLLQKHLDPDVLEVTDGFWKAEALAVYGKMVVDMTVPGNVDVGTVTTGR